MPSDADSLTERDLGDPSDVAADNRDTNGIVEADPTTSPDDEVVDAEVHAKIARAVDADLDTAFDDRSTDGDHDAEADSPFDGELRLPDENGYDGEDYGDDADYGDDDAEADSPFDGEFRLPDENGYDGEDYGDDADSEGFDGDEVLFDGDPEEFELDLGSGAYPAARPQVGDVLVLDDASAHMPVAVPRHMSRMERRRRVRLQARRVRRIIRHVEPWSVLKISVFFYACLWVIFLVAGFMIWGVAEGSGTVDKLESLIRSLFALETFDFDAGQIFRGYALGGLALSIAGTTFNVLMCLLFNLISDLTGGLRITMIEEETARPTPPRRRRRRPPPQRRR